MKEQGQMKILGISCSPRKGQTTHKAMSICLQAVEEANKSIETQLIELADLDIRPCVACGHCKNGLECRIKDDFSSLIPIVADNFGTMTAQCKALLDRCVMFRRNDWIFRNRLGGVLAVGGVRNGGQELTIQAVQAAMLCQDMICVSDGRDTAHFGAALWSGGHGGIDNDTIGLETARNLGTRMTQLAWRLK